MKILDFTHASSDAGVFLIVKNKKLVIAVIYVDNAIFFGKDKQVVKQVKQTFMDIWECHDIGKAKEFLRMKIQHKGKNIYLNQMSYLTKVVEHFGMRNAWGASTPLPTGYVPVKSMTQCTPEFCLEYQSIIGSLLYIMLGTCPDITYTITKIAQYSVNPSKEHMDKAQYICRYLGSTKH